MRSRATIGVKRVIDTSTNNERGPSIKASATRQAVLAVLFVGWDMLAGRSGSHVGVHRAHAAKVGMLTDTHALAADAGDMREVDEVLRFMRARGASPRLVRHHELVVEAAEQLLADLREVGRDAWSLFVALDDCFERVAARGDSRLARSR